MTVPARLLTTCVVALAAGLGLAGCASIPGLPAPKTSASKAPNATPTEEAPSRSASSGSTRRPSSTRTTRPSATPDADDIENGYLRRSSVELKIATAVREKTGQTAAVECPGNLTAKVGETMTCKVLRLDGKTIPEQRIEVKVEEIDGQRVRYSMATKN